MSYKLLRTTIIMEKKGNPADIVFSKTINAGKRIYYLDVKKNRKGELFLCITESKRVYSDETESTFQLEKHKIFLYQEDFQKFANSMNDIFAYIKQCGSDDNSDCLVSNAIDDVLSEVTKIEDKVGL